MGYEGSAEQEEEVGFGRARIGGGARKGKELKSPSAAAPQSSGVQDLAAALKLTFSAVQQAPPAALIIAAAADTRFHPEEVGFFKPLAEQTTDIEQVGKDVYLHDVRLFVSRAQTITKRKGEPTVSAQLDSCLRGSALSWFMTLSEHEHERLTSGGINAWSNALLQQFKKSPSLSLDQLVNERYTLLDAATGQDTTDYIQSVVRHAQGADMLLAVQHVNWAWKNLDPELQDSMNKPAEWATVMEFIQQLDSKKEVWFRCYEHLQFTSRNSSNQNRRPQSPFRPRSPPNCA